MRVEILALPDMIIVELILFVVETLTKGKLPDKMRVEILALPYMIIVKLILFVVETLTMRKLPDKMRVETLEFIWTRKIILFLSCPKGPAQAQH